MAYPKVVLTNVLYIILLLTFSMTMLPQAVFFDDFKSDKEDDEPF